MQYLKFTYIDTLTGISVATEPAMNGTSFPNVAGLEFAWARESEYPTQVPAFFGTCPDDISTQVEGVMGVFPQSDWEQMQADEMRVRPDPEAQRIAALWHAADAYEKAQISGSATALLVVGVIQGLPVSLAIKGWIKTIWAEYYIRKATNSTDTDFSFAGPIPHSVPELMQELGV